MQNSALPKSIERVQVPPIKCQGIKTKLVPFILKSVKWDGGGMWIEPFLGSGVVAFNAGARRAVLADKNRHIIEFYQAIQSGRIMPSSARAFLEDEGKVLRTRGEKHYYAIRERFNEAGDPLDFLFLSRAGFNGVMRFNSRGGFNVPWNRKPERFSPRYVSRIVNQLAAVAQILEGRDWEFRCCDWTDTLAEAMPADFVYADPPYIGRHTDYYGKWSEADEDALGQAVRALPCGFAYSTWKCNRYRENARLETDWAGFPALEFEHFYHVGPTESLRNSMTEALVVSPECPAPTMKRTPLPE